MTPGDHRRAGRRTSRRLTPQTDTILERFKTDGIKTVLAVNNSVERRRSPRWERRTTARASSATARQPLPAAALEPGHRPVGDRGRSQRRCRHRLQATRTCRSASSSSRRPPATRSSSIRPQGEPDYRVSAQTACRYIPFFAALDGCRRQEPHRGELRQGGPEARIGPDSGLRHDHVRPEDPHVRCSRCSPTATTRRSPDGDRPSRSPELARTGTRTDGGEPR